MGVYIRVDEHWKPWANTVAYYKLDSNLNDSSGNGMNWTWYNWAWTFSDGVLDLWWSHSIELPFTLAWLTDWTFNIRMKVNQNKTINGILGTATWIEWTMHIQYVYTSNDIVIWVNPYSEIQAITTLNIGSWYNITMTKSWTTYKIYINWALAVSWTSWNFTDTSTLYLWMTYETARCWNWCLSNAIFEDVARTAEEIADYYNYTKSNYWIS